ncbi:MAG: hypothetical protein HZB51_20875 [Chloroflexi bacterium]|nr:hypothetical protein [Chloroflexota bacterium]
MSVLSSVSPHACLAFVETADQVRQILSSPAHRSIDHFVALGADAAWALCEKNISYLKLEDGYAESDLCALAQPTLDEQQKWADWVDRFLQDSIPKFRTHQFRPAQLYLYWLKIVFDNLSIRAYTLDWALRQWNPKRIIFPGRHSANYSFGSDLQFRETLYPVVLRRVVRGMAIDAELLSEPVGLSNRVTQRNSFHSLGRLLFSRVSPTLEYARDIINGVNFSGHGAIVLGSDYDLESVWTLAQRRARLTPWRILVNRFRRLVNSTDYAQAREWMAQTWQNIESLAEFRQPTHCAGYNLWSCAKDRVHFWWHVLVPQQWAVYQGVRRYYQNDAPIAVAVSGLGDHVERGIFSALRSLGVRAFIYQHGGFVGWCECPPWDTNDLTLAQYELCHGWAMSKHFETRKARSARPLATPISVGSSRLDTWLVRMARLSRPTKRRPQILIVPNLIPENNRYLDCGTLPDVTESEIQIAMVSVAREFPQYDFVFKAFPGQFNAPATRLALQPGINCRVVFKKRIPLLVAQSDLIVLNFPSTGMMEALISDRQIILLADPRSIRMFPEAKAALAKRVTLTETPEEFIAAFHAQLTKGIFKPINHPDQSFLEMYGTHLNDGHSAERAWDAILNHHDE